MPWIYLEVFCLNNTVTLEEYIAAEQDKLKIAGVLYGKLVKHDFSYKS